MTTLSLPHPAKMSFVEPDNPDENIYSDDDCDDDMASESSASESDMDVTDDGSVADMTATNGGRGRRRERGFGRGIGRRHGRGCGAQVLCTASDICNTWDNADTAVTGNTPANPPRERTWYPLT